MSLASTLYTIRTGQNNSLLAKRSDERAEEARRLAVAAAQRDEMDRRLAEVRQDERNTQELERRLNEQRFASMEARMRECEVDRQALRETLHDEAKFRAQAENAHHQLLESVTVASLSWGKPPEPRLSRVPAGVTPEGKE